MKKLPAKNNSGVVLLIVLSTLLVVVALANIILMIIGSHSRLTQHQVDRIKAYYSAQAGMNLAFEKLRTGDWTTGNYTVCASGCDFNDSDLSPLTISIGAIDSGLPGTRLVTITSSYTTN